MKHMSLKLVLVTALAFATAGPLTGADSTATSGSGPTFKHLGPLAFGPDGVLFAADGQEVSITALQLAKQMAGGTPGTKDVPGINQKIAALLGIDAKNLLITDMVVNPKTGNTFISAMRGLGANATPVKGVAPSRCRRGVLLAGSHTTTRPPGMPVLGPMAIANVAPSAEKA